MSDSADPLNLTGVWHGNYTYPDGSAAVSFVATLIEAGGHVSGSTHEPHGYRPETLYALLSGTRAGRAVTFTKRCQGGDARYAAPIDYDGTLNQNGTEIEGRWIIHHEWSGRFLMIRSARRTTAASKAKFERA